MAKTLTAKYEVCPECGEAVQLTFIEKLGPIYWCPVCQWEEWHYKQDKPDKAALLPKDRSTAQGEHRDKSADQADPV